MLWTDQAHDWRHGPTEALRHGVNLLLEVREDMVRDVLYQEVDVPGDVVGRVDCGVDDPPLYGVAGRHGHLVYEGKKLKKKRQSECPFGGMRKRRG